MRPTPCTRLLVAAAPLLLLIATVAASCTAPAAKPQPTAAPALDPTIAPALGVEVLTATVDDRLPASLRGRRWAATTPSGLVTGSLGNPSRLVLPATQVFLASSGELVISGQRKLDGTSTVVMFWTWGNGSQALPPVTVPGQLVTAVVAGDHLFATGFDATSAGDPGVVSISLVDGSVTSVIPSGPAPADVGRPVARNVLVSPSGRTVLSSLCTPSGCTGGTIIDAATGTIRGSLASTDGPSALNDEVALVRGGGEITTEIALVDLASGAERWRQHADEYAHGYVTDAGDVVILLSRGKGANLARISGTGDERDSGRLPGHLPSLWVDLSSAALAVIGDDGPFPGSVGADGVVRASVFDLDAWTLLPDAIQVDIDGQQ